MYECLKNKMDRNEIILQLAAHFEQNFDRIRTLELTIETPTTGGGEFEQEFEKDYVAYGTAGFRGRAEKISHLFYNVGLIAGLRCLSTGRANLGVMITASHNPVEDNGVKIIDANGNMLESRWETIVEKFCNISHNSIDSAKNLFEQVDKLLSKHVVQSGGKIEISNLQSGLVMLGHDTRPSSQALIKLVEIGLDAWAPLISYKSYGLVTTPALHYLVGESTRLNFQVLEVEDYYKKLAHGLVKAFESSADKQRQHYNPAELIVDNANGVGSITMKYLNDHEGFRSYLPLELINMFENEVSTGILNSECGADYVKTRHLAPRNANQIGKRYASLDGDADRVVYFYLKNNNKEEVEEKRLHLLDGDKILALIAYYLVDKLKEYKLIDELSLGVVQTAYANGASTDYLVKQLGLQVDCVDTGVKHLHKRATDYDFGVYFEANGHGTIWVSDKAKAKIAEHHVIELEQLLSVLNNYTGDAISDVLIVESILNHYDWNIQKWDELYEDRPNSLIKVEIRDRELVQTTNAGRTCLSPVGLQQKIDDLVGKYGPNARSFVRASGTENVVRIYAECQSSKAAMELAKTVGEVVIDLCNNNDNNDV